MGREARSSAQVLTFAVGGEAFAVEAGAVTEVVPAPPVTRVPQSPLALKGVANVRGRVLPILAIERVVDGVGSANGTRVIVLGGDHGVGLAVDSIGALRTVEASGGDLAAELVATEEGPARLLHLDALIAGAFGGARPRRAQSRQAAAPAAAAVVASELAFLEFRVSGQAYATPLDQVRSISAAPKNLQALPGADAAMLGLLSLRDRLLPVVSPAAVLGLEASRIDARSRIVVVAIGEAEAGLLVDEVRGVLRVPADRLGAVPALLNRAAGEARIESIVRAGDRLVSILPADRVLDEATVAGLLAEGERDQAAEPQENGAMQRILLFRLGEESYGMPVERVDAVIQLPASITRVPKAPPFVAGVVNHRGRVVPLIDQALRFAAPARGAGRRRVIIASLDGLTAGFIVDAVDQIVSVSDAQLQPTPELAAGEAGVFDRVASVEHDGSLVLLVDPRQLLDQAERDLLKDVAETQIRS
jgi:purine-binding chemotaxis protein CheW